MERECDTRNSMSDWITLFIGGFSGLSCHPGLSARLFLLSNLESIMIGYLLHTSATTWHPMGFGITLVRDDAHDDII